MGRVGMGRTEVIRDAMFMLWSLCGVGDAGLLAYVSGALVHERGYI